jgi:hypothetical protein
MGRVVRGAKCPWGEMSVGRNVHGAKYPWGEMSVGRDVVWRVVVGRVLMGRVVREPGAPYGSLRNFSAI